MRRGGVLASASAVRCDDADVERRQTAESCCGEHVCRPQPRLRRHQPRHLWPRGAVGKARQGQELIPDPVVPARGLSGAQQTA